MTRIVQVDADRPDPQAIAGAAKCLQQGGLVAFPTETVYGLGVHAVDREAVKRLFIAKGRPANDPLIVHIADAAQLGELVDRVPEVARALAQRFWPGPLTLVMRRSAAIPDEVTAGLGTVAVRVPSHPVARALLNAARIPVAAPSANLFSRPSPTRASHVVDDLDGRIDMVLDGGPTFVGLESTVLDLTATPPVVLRPGAVGIEELRAVVPDVRVRASAETAGDDRAPMPAPGLLGKHYAPRAPLTLFRGNSPRIADEMRRIIHEESRNGRRVGVLATHEDAAALRSSGAVVVELGSERDLEAISSRLYTALRGLDAAGVELILARDLTTDEGLGRAIRDRLQRAAATTVEVR